MALCSCVIVLLVIVSALYLYCKDKYSYWSSKGIKGPSPLPFIGNFGKVILQKESVNQYMKNIHLEYRNEKLVGLYRGFKPVLLIRDPELIKDVLVKNFHVFQDRGVATRSNRLNENLFGAQGEKWKLLRQKLTPLFTSRKLKDMTPLIQDCLGRFLKYVDKIVEDDQDHEIRSLTGKYTLEVIGSCAFGLNLNIFEHENNEFSIMAKKIFTRTIGVSILIILDIIIPGIRQIFRLNTDIQIFFLNLVNKVIEERDGKPSTRKDFMDLMIELKEQGKLNRKLDEGTSEIEIDDYVIAAQAFVFYAAGFDTSSATMSFMIYELALNQDIQQRTYEDICLTMAKYNNEINYESVTDMKYLEMVFDETLRKYTVAGILFRQSLTDYKFPETDLTISKGMMILISASGLSADPEYFASPQKFDPENFSSENVKNLSQGIYMPFGDGPRNCIGKRFAKVQTLIGIAGFLKKFKVEPSPKTSYDLKFDPTAMILNTKDGIWVKTSKRQQ